MEINNMSTNFDGGLLEVLEDKTRDFKLDSFLNVEEINSFDIKEHDTLNDMEYSSKINDIECIVFTEKNPKKSRNHIKLENDLIIFHGIRKEITSTLRPENFGNFFVHLKIEEAKSKDYYYYLYFRLMDKDNNYLREEISGNSLSLSRIIFGYNGVLVKLTMNKKEYNLNISKLKIFKVKKENYLKGDDLYYKNKKINDYCTSIFFNEIKYENHYKEIDIDFSSQYLDQVYNFINEDPDLENIEEDIYNDIESKENDILRLKIPKNLLIKGVPGTGKSRYLDKIISKLNIEIGSVLRVNIHSGTNNSDLMQGISVSVENQNIKYEEKTGVILTHIVESFNNPYVDYVLVLEEIQENSLNKLIGDLIYLIEDDKRFDNKVWLEKQKKIIEDDFDNEDLEDNDEQFDYFSKLNKDSFNKEDFFVIMPNLVSANKEKKYLVLPKNFYIFCTTNYRDDKKIIEDNLLRRFDVVELYPKKEIIKNDFVRNIFENLNDSIEIIMNKKGEIHPDRFLLGHANWIDCNSFEDVEKAFLKFIIEFKDIKNIEFSEFNEIIKLLISKLEDKKYYNSENIKKFVNSKTNLNNYRQLIELVQKSVYGDLMDLIYD